MLRSLIQLLFLITSLGYFRYIVGPNCDKYDSHKFISYRLNHFAFYRNTKEKYTDNENEESYN